LDVVVVYSKDFVSMLNFFRKNGAEKRARPPTFLMEP